jgi:PAS domain S-box-containing protein
MSKSASITSNLSGIRFIIFLTVLLSILLIIGGFLYYKYESDRIKSKAYEELNTIADIKNDQITQWLKERKADAKHFSKSSLYVKAIEKWLKTKDTLLGSEIIRRNIMIKELRGIQSVFIVTKENRKQYLRFDSIHNEPDTLLSQFSDSVFKNKKIYTTDFYLYKGHIQFAIISPIIDNANTVIGALVFLIDPKTYFFPLIQSWPTSSKTSEIIIVRRDGDSIVVINEMKHNRQSALRMRFPVTRSDLLIVKVGLGQTGTFEGTDYRNNEVLAYFRKISGSPWFMITKVEKSEILEELRYRAIVITIIVFVLIVLISLVCGWYYLHQKNSNYRLLLLKEKEMRKMEDEYRITLYSVGEGVISTDRNGTVKQLNREAEKLTGWKESEAQGKPLEAVLKNIYEKSPERSNKLKDKVFAVPSMEGIYTDNILIAKDGQMIPVSICSSPIKNDSGESQGIVIVFKDQTNEKEAQNILANSENRLNRAELISKSGNYEFHLATRTITASLGAQQLFEIDGVSCNFKYIHSLILPEYREMIEQSEQNLIKHGDSFDVEYKIKRPKKGDIIDIHSVATYDKQKGIIFAVIRDVTDMKVAERELIKAKDKAEKSDKLKEAFLQNMSHEIRTPLNAISGFAELLSSSGSLEKTKSYASIIINSSNQLLSIVNDILTIARIQTGQEVLNIQPVNIREVLNEIEVIFRPKVIEKGLKFEVIENLKDIPVIETDKTKLQQIINNLLTNAIKFTQQGFIEIGCSYHNNFFEFYVKDSGIGINPKAQEFIFERFAQADNINIQFGGTGLGLSISKEFVTLLGGTIWLLSETEKGSEFHFTIPYKPSQINKSMDAIDLIPENNSVKKILIAEDEDYNLLLVQEILKNHYILLSARNGKEAIELCKQHTDIGLVLMDIKMPEMDGLTAMMEIKKMWPHLPVIAQTAYALIDEIELYMKKGFDDYITKPIKRDELIRKVAKCL